MSAFADRQTRIERCRWFIEIEGTEWREFYSPIIEAADRGNGGGFDEDAEILVQLVEWGIDMMVESGHYSEYYGDDGGPEREAGWRAYRKENPTATKEL